MAGMLDFLMNGGGSQGPQIGMLAADGFLPVDAAMADEARNAAAARMRRGVKRQGVTEAVPAVEAGGIDPWQNMPAAELTNTSMGLGPGAGAGYSQATDPNMPRPAAPIEPWRPSWRPPDTPDAPPSTNDPFSAEPALFQDGGPVNRPRPPEAGANPDPGSGQVSAPLSLAPGDYQDRAALPANATPTIGQGGPVAASAAPQSALGGIGDTLGGLAKGIWNRATDPNTASTRLALAAGFAGAPSFGTGMRRAFTGAVPAMQTDRAFAQKQEGIAQTYKALVAKGVPPAEALAAVNNPDVLKATAAKYFETKPRSVHDITDMQGNKTPVTYDPNTGKFYDMGNNEIKDAGAHTASAAAANPANINPETGLNEKYLATLDQETQNSVKAFREGRANVAGRNLQKMLPLITSYDPNFQAADYPVKLATRKSYTSGADFKETQALNTVAGHLGNLVTAAEGLGNTAFKPWNYIKNAVQDATVGSPALVKFRNDLVTTQNELAKAYHGGHVSDSAYAAFNKAIGEAQTPAELKTAIGELGSLLQSKIEAKESGYRSSMGQAPLPSEFKAVNDHARDSFDRIGAWARGEPLKAASHGPAAASAPANAPVAPNAPASALPRVSSPLEAAKLPKGSQFIDPAGNVRTVP